MIPAGWRGFRGARILPVVPLEGGTWAPWALLLGAACQPRGAAFSLPPLPVDGAAILALRDHEGGHQLYAFEGQLAPFTAADLAELILVTYPDDLAALGLLPGRLEEGRDREHVPLVTIDATVYASTVKDGEPGPFATLPGLPEWLTEVRIKGPPTKTLLDCATAGGCYLDEAAQHLLDCTIPCPVAPPVIAAPSPVDMRPCPPGWSEIREGLQVRCAPPPRVAECPGGEVQWIDRSGCEPLGVPCSASGFPDVSRVGRLIHVLPGAIAGDGSEASPYGRLDTALIGALPGDAILIGPGRLELDAAAIVPSGVDIYGCSASTVLASGTLALDLTGSSTIARLRIEAHDGIVARKGAEATLEDLELVGDGDGRAISADGPVTGTRLKSRRFGSLLWGSAFTGPVHLARIDSRQHSSSAIYLESGPALIEDAIILDGDSVAVEGRRLAGVRLTLRRSRFDGLLAGTVAIDGAEAELDQVQLSGTAVNEEDLSGNGYYQNGGHLLAKRVYVALHGESGLWLYGASGELEDFWAEDSPRGGALSLQASSDAGDRRPVQMRVRRMYARHVGRSLSASDEVDYTIEDLSVAAPTEPGGGLVVGNFVVGSGPQNGVIRRAELTGALGRAVWTSSGSPSLLLEDFAIRPGAEDGIVIWGGSVVLRRVSIESLAPGPADTIGIFVKPGQRLDADGFLLDRTGRAGLSLRTEDYQLSNGVISGCQFGIGALSPRYEALTRRILYRDNGSAIVIAN